MRRNVSLILTLSFVITAITGLMMFAHLRMVTPIHEIMAIVLVIVSIFHIALNAKCITSYVKQKPVLAGVLTVMTIAVVTLLMFAAPHHRMEGGPRGFQGHNSHFVEPDGDD